MTAVVSTERAMAEVGNLGLARASNIVAGLLGVIGIFVAQRARGPGRVTVMLAGVVAPGDERT